MSSEKWGYYLIIDTFNMHACSFIIKGVLHTISFLIELLNKYFTYYFVVMKICEWGVPTNSTKIEPQRILMIPQCVYLMWNGTPCNIFKDERILKNDYNYGFKIFKIYNICPKKCIYKIPQVR